MGIVSAHDIDDETRELVLDSGEHIRLHLEEGAVRVVNSQGAEVGAIHFGGSVYDFGNGNDVTAWHITNMFIRGEGGKYMRQGIGTQAVRYFLWAHEGDEFEVTKNDGQRRDDGSHLTGDGVPFMAHLARLQAKGELLG